MTALSLSLSCVLLAAATIEQLQSTTLADLGLPVDTSPFRLQPAIHEMSHLNDNLSPLQKLGCLKEVNVALLNNDVDEKSAKVAFVCLFSNFCFWLFFSVFLFFFSFYHSFTFFCIRTSLFPCSASLPPVSVCVFVVLRPSLPLFLLFSMFVPSPLPSHSPSLARFFCPVAFLSCCTKHCCSVPDQALGNDDVLPLLVYVILKSSIRNWYVCTRYFPTQPNRMQRNVHTIY